MKEKELISMLFDALQNVSDNILETTQKILELGCFEIGNVIEVSLNHINERCAKNMKEEKEKTK